jgi:hypothetical protein
MTSGVEERSAGWTADDSTFGARLALIRQRMGWGNVKEAALACGLPVESWRAWERNNVAPRRYIEICRAISERTGCSFRWLAVGPDEGVPSVPTRQEATFRGERRPVTLRDLAA